MAHNVHPIDGMDKASREKLIERHTDACMAVMALAQANERLRRMNAAEDALAIEQILRRTDLIRGYCALRLFPKRDQKGKR